jgi:hypothetical protein
MLVAHVVPASPARVAEIVAQVLAGEGLSVGPADEVSSRVPAPIATLRRPCESAGVPGRTGNAEGAGCPAFDLAGNVPGSPYDTLKPHLFP